MNDQPPSPGHERSDVHTRGIWFAGLGIAVTCVVIAFIMTLMFNHLYQRAKMEDRRAAENNTASAVAQSRPQFPGPQLVIKSGTDLAAFRAEEEKKLNDYGWVDKKAGIVRIPIERAIDLTAQRGLPVNGAPGAPVPYRTSLDLQQGRPLEFPTPAPTATPWVFPAATPMGASPAATTTTTPR